MERRQPVPLRIATLFALFLLGLPALARSEVATVSLEAALGSPWVSLEAGWLPNPRLTLGARLDLADGLALRAGPVAHLTWLEVGPLSFAVDAVVLRTFPLANVVSTWDAELSLSARFPLDDRSDLELLGGAVGYLGPNPDQRGLLALGALRAWRALGSGHWLGVELGWIGGRGRSRPLGSLRWAVAF